MERRPSSSAPTVLRDQTPAQASFRAIARASVMDETRRPRRRESGAALLVAGGRSRDERWPAPDPLPGAILGWVAAPLRLRLTGLCVAALQGAQTVGGGQACSGQ